MGQMAVSMILRLIDQMSGEMEKPKRSLGDLQREIAKTEVEIQRLGGNGGSEGARIDRRLKLNKLKDDLADLRTEAKAFNETGSATAGVLADIASKATAAAAAYGGLKLAKDALEEGNKALQVKAGMMAAGMSPDELKATASAAAKFTSQYPLFGRTEIERMIADVRPVVGGTAHAIDVMPDLLKFRAAYERANPGKDSEHVMHQLVKAMEVGNLAKDAQTFRTALEVMAKAMNAFRGTVKPGDYAAYFGKIGANIAKLDPDYLQNYVPTLLNTMSGKGASEGQLAFYSAFTAGRMTQQQAESLEKLGLLNEAKVERSKTGTIKRVMPGGVVGADLALSNPFRWVNEVLKPALDKAGVVGKDRDLMLQGMFSQQNTQRFVQTLLEQAARFKKDAEIIRKAQGLDAMKTYRDTDPAYGWAVTKTQLNNYLRNAGAPVASAKTANWGADLSTWMSDWSAANPKSALASVLGVGAALSGGGLYGLRGLFRWFTGSGAAEAAKPSFMGGIIKGAAKAPLYAVGGLVDGAGDALRAAGVVGKPLGRVMTGLRAGPAVGLQIGGEYAIDKLFDALPKPAYPKGYDPKAELAMMPWDRAARLFSNLTGGAPKPAVDTSAIEAAPDKAKQASEQMKAALDVVFKPDVDTSGLKAALDLANALKSTLEGVGRLAAGIGASAGRGLKPSTGAMHDGYETK